VVDVRLVDLEVIKRYSLAVRRDAVPAAELLEALDASRAVVAAALAAEAHSAEAHSAEAVAPEAHAAEAHAAEPPGTSPPDSAPGANDGEGR
jgi:hypothetical protein